MKCVACIAAVAAAAGVLVAMPAAADGMFKCKDAAGRITYAGKECEQLGLTSAGEVKGRASITPALKFKEQPKPGPAKQPKVAAPPAAAPETAKKPERRCFTIKTKTGTATRCNDVPPPDPSEKSGTSD